MVSQCCRKKTVIEEISRCDKTALYYRSPVFKKKEMPPFIIETHLCIMLRQKE